VQKQQAGEGWRALRSTSISIHHSLSAQPGLSALALLAGLGLNSSFDHHHWSTRARPRLRGRALTRASTIPAIFQWPVAFGLTCRVWRVTPDIVRLQAGRQGERKIRSRDSCDYGKHHVAAESGTRGGSCDGVTHACCFRFRPLHHQISTLLKQGMRTSELSRPDSCITMLCWPSPWEGWAVQYTVEASSMKRCRLTAPAGAH